MTSLTMLSSSLSSSEDEATMEEEDEDTVRCTHILESIDEEEEPNPLQAALDAITQLAKEAELHSIESYREKKVNKAKKASVEEPEHVLGSRRTSSVDNTFGAGETDEQWDEDRKEARIRAKLLYSSFDEDRFKENYNRKYSKEDNDGKYSREDKDRKHSREDNERKYSKEEDNNTSKKKSREDNERKYSGEENEKRYGMEWEKGKRRKSEEDYSDKRKNGQERDNSERRYREEDNADRKHNVEEEKSERKFGMEEDEIKYGKGKEKYSVDEENKDRGYSKREYKDESKNNKIVEDENEKKYGEYNSNKKYSKERFQDKKYDLLNENRDEKNVEESEDELKNNKCHTIEQNNRKKEEQNSSFPTSYSLFKSKIRRPSWDPASLIDDAQQVDQPEAEVRQQAHVEPRVQDQGEVEPPTPPPRKSRLWPFKFGKRSQESFNRSNLDKTNHVDDLEKENLAHNLEESNKEGNFNNNESSENREKEYIKDDNDYYGGKNKWTNNNGYGRNDAFDNKSYNWKRNGDCVKSDESDKGEDRKADNVEMRDEYVIEARDPNKYANEKENYYKNNIENDLDNERNVENDNDFENEEEKINGDGRSHSSINIDNTQVINNEEGGRKMSNNDVEDRPLKVTKTAYNEGQESREGSYERILEASPDALQSDLLWPCPICNRTFTRAALERHLAICRRVSAKKRPLFGQSRSTPTTPSSSPSVQRRKKSNTIEDELQICLHCGRKFNFKAFDKHAQWCAEKHRRLMQSPNKDAQALAKLHARTHYRPSSVNRDEIGLRKQSSTYSLLSAVSPTPSRSSVMTTNDISSRMNNSHTKESEQTQFIRAATGRGSIRKGPAPTKASQLRQLTKEKKESGHEPIYAPRRTPSRSSSFRRLNKSPGLMSQSYHAGDGQLQRQLSNLSQLSMESSARPRIMRSEPEGTEMIDGKVVEAYDHSVEYDPYKSAEQQMQALLFGTKLSKTSMRPSSNSAFEKYVPSTSDINTKMGGNVDEPRITAEIERPTSTRVARFCHECGSPFALPTIRFCCECGVRRLYC